MSCSLRPYGSADLHRRFVLVPVVEGEVEVGSRRAEVLADDRVGA